MRIRRPAVGEGAPRFVAESGVPVPAVTAEQMREVDRVAVEEFGLALLQMMENAGRNLAEQVFDMLAGTGGRVAVLAGPGGNGGGGFCAARHLHNRGLPVSVILNWEGEELAGVARTQLHILAAAGVRPVEPAGDTPAVLRAAALVIDALIGYGLRGAPRGGRRLSSTCATPTRDGCLPSTCPPASTRPPRPRRVSRCARTAR